MRIALLSLAAIILLRIRTTVTLTGCHREHNVFIMIVTIMSLFVVLMVFLSVSITFASFVKELISRVK